GPGPGPGAATSPRPDPSPTASTKTPAAVIVLPMFMAVITPCARTAAEPPAALPSATRTAPGTNADTAPRPDGTAATPNSAAGAVAPRRVSRAASRRRAVARRDRTVPRGQPSARA